MSATGSTGLPGGVDAHGHHGSPSPASPCPVGPRGAPEGREGTGVADEGEGQRSPSPYRGIRHDVEGALLVLTIDRPDVLDAPHPDAHREMSDALDRCAADASLRVVIITGAGESPLQGSSTMGFGIMHLDVASVSVARRRYGLDRRRTSVGRLPVDLRNARLNCALLAKPTDVATASIGASPASSMCRARAMRWARM